MISDAINIIMTLENDLHNTNSDITQLLLVHSPNLSESLNPTEEDMISHLPTELECLGLSRHERGKLSVLISHAEHTAMRLCRLRDTLFYLSLAYHNEDGQQKVHLKSALRHGRGSLLTSIFTWSDTSTHYSSAHEGINISDLDLSTSSCSTSDASTSDSES